MKFQDTIAIIGLGYVGLPTAMYFSSAGVRTIGIEISEEKVELLNSGVSPISDKFIEEKLPQVIHKDFTVTSNFKAIQNAKVILIVLPTPVGDTKKPDLSFIRRAAEEISKYLLKNQLVVLESTVYPGVTEEVLVPILEKSGLKADIDFGIAYCPERFNPGDMNHTIDKTVRVIGANTEKWKNLADQLYSSIQETFPTTSIKTAEMCKVIENTQRDLNIALMNELAIICEKMDLDIMDVLHAAFTKWNFGRYFPGPGVGGHCLPHDPYYLVDRALEMGYKAQIIIAGRELNDSMPLHIFQLLIKGLNDSEKALSKSRIAIFGAVYKANIDDLRSSPSETLINELREYNADVVVVEPNVSDAKIFGFPNIVDFKKLDLNSLDAIVIMVDHKEFKLKLQDYLLTQKLDGITIVDGKRIFEKSKFYKKKCKLISLGSGLKL